jgi:hypothetical protein
VDALLAALNMDYPTGPHPIAGVNCDMMGNPILGENAGGMARELAAQDSESPNDING